MKTYAKLVLMLLTMAVLFATAAAGYAQQALSDPGADVSHPSLLHFRLGLYYQLKGDQPRAIAEFSETITALPDYGYAYAARGESYAALGDYEHSIADYSAALAIYPDLVSTLYTRGRAYLALGEAEHAADDFSNATQQLSDYAPAYWGLGDVYFAQEQYGDALSSYQTYLTLADDAADILVIDRIATLQTMAAAGTL